MENKMGLSFEIALTNLKYGARVAREGWNGKGMFLFLVTGETVTQAINEQYVDENTSLPVVDAIYMKTADNKLVPWLASQTDILATDWTIKQLSN